MAWDVVVCAPPAGGAAGQNQSASGHRKAYFLRMYRSAIGMAYLQGQHIRQNRGGQPGGVGVDQEK